MTEVFFPGGDGAVLPPADAAVATGVVVRRLVPDDWETLRDVRLAALLDAPYAFLSTYAEVSRWDEPTWRARPVNAAMFGGWVDGRPLGMVGLIPAAASDDPSGGCALVAMWVAPDARGSGLAGALIDAAVAQAEQSGAPSVVLEVAPGNDRAERVYRRHGFVPVDDAPHGPGDLVMRRVLS
jgi:ribosomal protein S18 acetylase RimI-like enzyme